MDELLQGSTDAHVWEVAQREERMLVTTDEDLVQIWRSYVPGSMGLFYIRVREQKTIPDRLVEWFSDPLEVAQRRGSLVVASTSKLRIRAC